MNKGRFKSQALLDEQAILSCMIYVDLNPIRADINKSLDTSEHTSIKQRIDEVTQTSTSIPAETIKLAPFIAHSQTEEGIAFSFKDYLELADWTGRIVRDDKKGFINASMPAILQKLQLDEETWMETVQGFSKGFHSFVGPEKQLNSLCKKKNRHWFQGINLCRKLFKPIVPFPLSA